MRNWRPLVLLLFCWDTLIASTTTTVHAFGISSTATSTKKGAPAKATKTAFLESLDTLDSLNAATQERTQMVRELTQENPTARPGSTRGFAPFAAGRWVVVYAPHMAFMSKLVGGRGFTPVWYDLQEDGTMQSHARFDIDLPLLPRTTGWLSVSGTYGTQDDNRICRVDFDKTWFKWNSDNESDSNEEDEPYPSLEDVPPSWEKNVIQTIGKWLFIDSFSVFPVSYLDEDLIVFDFELLGTRICARKIQAAAVASSADQR